MIWLLDTNTVIHAINGVVAVHDRLNEAWLTGRVVTSVLVRGELMYGAHGSQRRADNERQMREKLARFDVLPVTEAIADRYGQLKSELRKVGRPRADVDLLIAATAIEHGCTLVTDDEALLDGTITGLVAENWVVR